MRKRFLPIVVLLVVALVTVLSVRRAREFRGERGVYSGTIEAEESRVGSTVGGRVAQIKVREGDEVEAGQLLLLFESDELNAALQAALAAKNQASDRLRDLEAGPRQPEIDQARATVAQAREHLAKLKHGSRVEEIASAKAAMEQARQQLALLEAGPRKEDIDRARAEHDAATAESELAAADLARSEKLLQEGAISSQDLDRARTTASTAAARERAARRYLDALVAGSRVEDVQAARESYSRARAQFQLVSNGARAEDISAAEQAVKQAEANLAFVRAGTRPDQIAQARSAVEQASAAVDQIKARVRERAVLAPRPGSVQVLNVQVGDIVSAGLSVAVIIDPRQLFIRIYVPQEQLGNLAVGARLPIVTDSGITAEGTVEQIPTKAEFTPRNVQTREERALQVFAVKVRVSNHDARLRAGMSAEVRLAD